MLNTERVLDISFFELGKAIGETIDGKLRLAVHKPTGKKVTCHIIEKNLLVLTSVTTERICGYIKANRMIKHPNLTQLFTLVENKQAIFEVFEYFEGKTLMSYILEKKKVNEEDAKYIISQILNAVQYLDTMNIYLRELSLQNITIDNDLFVKIKHSSNATNPHKLQLEYSSPYPDKHYASPQVLEGAKYSIMKSEVWSLGVLIYGLVCGYLPFDEFPESGIFHKKKELEINFPYYISDSLKELLNGMLNPDEELRFDFDDVCGSNWIQNDSRACNYLYLGLGLDTKWYYCPVDMEIVKKICSLHGMNKDEVICSVALNNHNNLTATYYLTLNGNQMKIFSNSESCSPSFFGGEIFSAFASNNANELLTYTDHKEYLTKMTTSINIVEKYMNIDLFETTFMDNPEFLNVSAKAEIKISKKRSTVLGDLVMVNEIGETNLQSKLKIFSSAGKPQKPPQRSFDPSPKTNFKRQQTKMNGECVSPVNKSFKKGLTLKKGKSKANNDSSNLRRSTLKKVETTRRSTIKGHVKFNKDKKESIILEDSEPKANLLKNRKFSNISLEPVSRFDIFAISSIKGITSFNIDISVSSKRKFDERRGADYILTQKKYDNSLMSVYHSDEFYELSTKDNSKLYMMMKQTNFQIDHAPPPSWSEICSCNAACGISIFMPQKRRYATEALSLSNDKSENSSSYSFSISNTYDAAFFNLRDLESNSFTIQSRQINRIEEYNLNSNSLRNNNRRVTPSKKINLKSSTCSIEISTWKASPKKLKNCQSEKKDIKISVERKTDLSYSKRIERLYQYKSNKDCKQANESFNQRLANPVFYNLKELKRSYESCPKIKGCDNQFLKETKVKTASQSFKFFEVDLISCDLSCCFAITKPEAKKLIQDYLQMYGADHPTSTIIDNQSACTIRFRSELKFDIDIGYSTISEGFLWISFMKRYGTTKELKFLASGLLKSIMIFISDGK